MAIDVGDMKERVQTFRMSQVRNTCLVTEAASTVEASASVPELAVSESASTIESALTMKTTIGKPSMVSAPMRERTMTVEAALMRERAVVVESIAV
ncbi:MAG: hypothetical protein AAF432_07505 [Planctomycetota bacterium]